MRLLTLEEEWGGGDNITDSDSRLKYLEIPNEVNIEVWKCLEVNQATAVSKSIRMSFWSDLELAKPPKPNTSHNENMFHEGLFCLNVVRNLDPLVLVECNHFVPQILKMKITQGST